MGNAKFWDVKTMLPLPNLRFCFGMMRFDFKVVTLEEESLEGFWIYIREIFFGGG